MLYIKGARLVNPDADAGLKNGFYDIYIRDGRVEKLISAEDRKETLAGLPKETKVVDAEGKMAGPGLVDVHVHFRDPGQTAKEDIHTGALAAAAGGFTSVVMMANTKPTVSTPETLQYVLERASKEKIHVLASATVTMNMQGKVMTDMSVLSEMGAAGFTDDGVPVMDEQIMRNALKMSAKLKKPVSVHEENPAWIHESGVNAGPVAQALGLKGADREAEISMIERDIELVKECGGILDLQHISAAESVELIRRAKAAGLPVHAEATPHHFSLTEEIVLSLKTLAKMNPPLRTEEDRQAIIRGIQDGTLDMIATDHAPHTREEKARPFTQAPSGIIGLETSLALGLTNLVRPGYITAETLMTRMSYAPAALYGLDAGSVHEGGPADLVIFDPEEEYEPLRFKSKAENTPFAGQKLKGRVKMTVCGGEIVYNSEEG